MNLFSDGIENHGIPDRGKGSTGGNSGSGRYMCPYCGWEITKEDVLFWEKVRARYTDNVRGKFLRRHGAEVPPGNRFPRLYYRVREEAVVMEDENGFPTMIEDYPGNAFTFEDPEEERKPGESDGFDDDFDAFTDESESSRDRMDQTAHRIVQRACPGCHCELPMAFGTLETHRVAIIGSRAAGKTAYLVNLFRTLDMRMRRLGMGSVKLEKESEEFLNCLTKAYELTGIAWPDMRQSGPLLPIVCRFTGQEKDAFLIFYDIPDADAADPEHMVNNKGIAKCETVMLMMSPLLFADCGDEILWKHNYPLERHGTIEENCGNPLDSFLNSALILCREYMDHIKNIVCVITKLEMLMEADAEFFAADDVQVVRDTSDEHKGAVELDIFRRVSEELLRYLDKKFRVDLKERLDFCFGADKRIAILGISNSTLEVCAPGIIRFEDKRSPMSRKHRIIEPFLAVLMFCGLIRARNAEGEEGWLDEKREVKQERRRFFGWKKRV